MSVGARVRVSECVLCMHVCVCERDVSVCMSAYVCMSVCVCVRDRERECMCVSACACEKERG